MVCSLSYIRYLYNRKESYVPSKVPCAVCCNEFDQQPNSSHRAVANSSHMGFPRMAQAPLLCFVLHFTSLPVRVRLYSRP